MRSTGSRVLQFCAAELRGLRRLSAVPAALLRGCESLATLSLHGNPITADALRETDGFRAFDARRCQKYDKQARPICQHRKVLQQCARSASTAVRSRGLCPGMPSAQELLRSWAHGAARSTPCRFMHQKSVIIIKWCVQLVVTHDNEDGGVGKYVILSCQHSLLVSSTSHPMHHHPTECSRTRVEADESLMARGVVIWP